MYPPIGSVARSATIEEAVKQEGRASAAAFLDSQEDEWIYFDTQNEST
jgi:hypothetical protein